MIMMSAIVCVSFLIHQHVCFGSTARWSMQTTDHKKSVPSTRSVVVSTRWCSVREESCRQRIYHEVITVEICLCKSQRPFTCVAIWGTNDLFRDHIRGVCMVARPCGAALAKGRVAVEARLHLGWNPSTCDCGFPGWRRW